MIWRGAIWLRQLERLGCEGTQTPGHKSRDRRGSQDPSGATWWRWACFRSSFAGEGRAKHDLKGDETFTITGIDGLKPGATLHVTATSSRGEIRFKVKARIDNETEMGYYASGGVLPYVFSMIVNSRAEALSLEHAMRRPQITWRGSLGRCTPPPPVGRESWAASPRLQTYLPACGQYPIGNADPTISLCTFTKTLPDLTRV